MPPADLTPVRSGAETLVNTTTLYRQEAATVTALTDGSYVVTWIKQTGLNVVAWDVQAQRFAADGTALGSEFRVNTNTSDNQAGVDVVAEAGGGFTVLWTSFHSGTSNDVQAQRYGAGGVAIGGEFSIANDSVQHETGAQVVRLADGSHLVSYVTGVSGGLQTFARLYDADWNPAGTAFPASKVFAPSGGSTYLSGPGPLVALAGGNVMQIWTEPHASNNYSDVWAQILTPAGVEVGAAFRVNTQTGLEQGQPAVARLAGGEIVITYYSAFEGGTVFERFAADGSTKLGGEIRVDNTPNGALTPAITALADGGFVITWQGGTDGSGSAVSGQRFSADGTALGVNFLLNAEAAGFQSQPVVAQLNDGTLVTAWTSDTAVNSNDVKQQHFDLPPLHLAQIGTGAADMLTGGLGDDSLSGLGGNDTLIGNGGDDTLNGGAGNDSLVGGAGNDRLLGAAGADEMEGGTGNDTYLVTDVGDVVRELAGGGLDTVNTTLASYTLGAEVERLSYLGAGGFSGTGNGLDNRLNGGAGNDALSGQAGNDTLMGDAGADTLDGGAGMDRLFGGTGEDVFRISAIHGPIASNRTVILDWEAGTDLIDVSLIDPTGAGSAFQWIGTGGSSGGAELRYRVVGSNTQVFIEVGNGGTAEAMVTIAGVHTLSATDFLL